MQNFDLCMDRGQLPFVIECLEMAENGY